MNVGLLVFAKELRDALRGTRWAHELEEEPDGTGDG